MKSRLDPDIGGLPPTLTPPRTAPRRTSGRLHSSRNQAAAPHFPCVSVVIPHLNAPHLDACLASIYRHGATRSFEVIVVFDGSAPSDVQQIQARYPDIHANMLSNTNGFARACNAGASGSNATYLVFLNDDTTVTAGWLDRLVDFIESDPQIGIAGPKLLYPESEQIQHCGTVFNEQRLGEHIYRHSPSSLAAANRPRNYRAITGACVIVERELFLRLGGFDIRFHRSGGCEDTDLCFKILEQGRTVTYCPSCIVYHHEGISRGLRSEFHPEEVYNQQLLRRQWEKLMAPDIAEYDLLAEIEANELASWRWLRDVPLEIVARHCKRLHADITLLSAKHEAELHRASTERDAAQAMSKRHRRERDDLTLLQLQLRRELDALIRESGELDASRVELERLARERNAVADTLLRQTQLWEAMEHSRRQPLGARMRRTLRALLPGCLRSRSRPAA